MMNYALMTEYANTKPTNIHTITWYRNRVFVHINQKLEHVPALYLDASV